MSSPLPSTSKQQDDDDVIVLSSGSESDGDVFFEDKKPSRMADEDLDGTLEIVYDGPQITAVEFLTPGDIEEPQALPQEAGQVRNLNNPNVQPVKRLKRKKRKVQNEARNPKSLVESARLREEAKSLAIHQSDQFPVDPRPRERQLYGHADPSLNIEHGSGSSREDSVSHSPGLPDRIPSLDQILLPVLTFSDQIIKITDSAYWLLLTNMTVSVGGFARVSCFAGQAEIAGFRMFPSTKPYVLPSLDCESFISVHSRGDPIETMDFIANASKSFDVGSFAVTRVVGTLDRFRGRFRSVLLMNSTNSVSDPLLWKCVKLFPNLMPRTPEFNQTLMELQRVPSTRTRQALFPGCCLYSAEAPDVVYSNYQSQSWKDIRSALDEIPKPRMPVILVIGSKNAGKSTSVRFVVNHLLLDHPVIQCLDCDIGQSEFNPPGSIAIHSFTEPVFGPAFTRLHEPDASFYTGEVSPKKQSYLDGLRLVWETGRNTNTPLVINTMGFIEKLGLELLTSIFKLVRPNLIVELYQNANAQVGHVVDRMGDARRLTIQSPITYGVIKTQFNPAFRRKMSVIAYLSRISPDLGPINNVTPYKVKLNDIVVHFADPKLPTSHFQLALTGSYVALSEWTNRVNGQVDRYGGLQVVRGSTPVALTIGFGIVRAIDPVNGLMYILTPIKRAQLEKCNLLTRGTVLTPEEMFLGQDLTNYAGFLPRLQYRYSFEE